VVVVVVVVVVEAAAAPADAVVVVVVVVDVAGMIGFGGTITNEYFNWFIKSRFLKLIFSTRIPLFN
jgi:hypothetical protein